jgi:hypothetical protein
MGKSRKRRGEGERFSMDSRGKRGGVRGGRREGEDVVFDVDYHHCSDEVVSMISTRRDGGLRVTPSNGRSVASTASIPDLIRLSTTSWESTRNSSKTNGGERCPQSLSVGCDD